MTGALTWQTTACIMASNPPSGASRFPETLAAATSVLNRLVFRSSGMWFLKPYGATQSLQGFSSLRVHNTPHAHAAFTFLVTIHLQQQYATAYKTPDLNAKVRGLHIREIKHSVTCACAGTHSLSPSPPSPTLHRWHSSPSTHAFLPWEWSRKMLSFTTASILMHATKISTIRQKELSIDCTQCWS